MADTTGLDPSFAKALLAMIAESNGRITIASGYRSVERQTQLFNDAVKKYGSESAARHWVAPPGHSNHNRGLAVDLGGDIALAHQLAPKYGLSFPMSWEQWHIEPIGARDKSSPDAYTTSPQGEQNPTRREPNESEILASLTESMHRALVGELPDETGANHQTESTGAQASGGSADSFLNAIKQHESGGNYRAKNPHGSASGAYQFIDQTWNHYGGYAHAADAPPEVQDAKAREYLGSLQNATQDPRLWSVGWYGGPGMMQSVMSGKTSWDTQPNSGLSLRSYADWISSHMGVGQTPTQNMKV
jgi:hypothetical protein